MRVTRLSYRNAQRLVVLSILLTTAAQLLFRIGMKNSNAMALLVDGQFSSLMGWIASADALVVAAGIVLYAVSMLAWLAALTRFDVSFAYPLLSTTYVLVYLAATCWPQLGEQVSLQKLLGIAVIVAGVVILSGNGVEGRGQRNASHR